MKSPVKSNWIYLGTVEEVCCRELWENTLRDGLGKVERGFDIVAKIEGKPMRPFSPSPDKVRVYVNPSLTSTAGSSYYGRRLITINEALVELAGLRWLYENTLFHEYAHQLAQESRGDYRHGEDWRFVMESFGLRADRHLAHNIGAALCGYKRTKKAREAEQRGAEVRNILSSQLGLKP